MALLHIGEVARRLGVSAATIRHYERKGLLRPAIRTVSGYREFPPESLERMHMIQCALAVGFTIDELSRILRKRDAGEAPCREVHSLAQQRLAELTRRKNELDRLCRLLKSTLRQWKVAMAKTPRGKRAGLLQSLSMRSAWLAGMKSPLAHSRLGKSRRREL
jgi:DNA-binding transcriptional MerR regulator